MNDWRFRSRLFLCFLSCNTTPPLLFLFPTRTLSHARAASSPAGGPTPPPPSLMAAPAAADAVGAAFGRLAAALAEDATKRANKVVDESE